MKRKSQIVGNSLRTTHRTFLFRKLYKQLNDCSIVKVIECPRYAARMKSIETRLLRP